jgi:alpha-tubulin suppressor-like RCC1 family protein
VTSSWSAVSAGSSHSVGVLVTTGALYTWGQILMGSLVTGNCFKQIISLDSIGLLSWSVVAAGGSHTMGILATTGALYTWGFNNIGQLGDGTQTNRSSPGHIGLLSWSAISGGSSPFYGILTAPELYIPGVGTHMDNLAIILR